MDVYVVCEPVLLASLSYLNALTISAMRYKALRVLDRDSRHTIADTILSVVGTRAVKLKKYSKILKILVAVLRNLEYIRCGGFCPLGLRTWWLDSGLL
jgi:hypothetical protein